MKILSASQLKESDQYTVKNEPVLQINLMERAALAFAKQYKPDFPKETLIKIFCGMGNNGGDALAVARLLHHSGYDLKVYLVRHSDTPTDEVKINEERLRKLQTVPVYDLKEDSKLPPIAKNEIVIDGLLGSGLNRNVDEASLLGRVISLINKSGARTVAVDIPSGMFADKFTDSLCIKAAITYTFTSPKYAFLFSESYPLVGDWKVLDIGISDNYLNKLDSKNIYVTLELASALLAKHKRNKFDHKGKFGHSLIIAGSYGKFGAAVLATKACVNTGSGLTTVYAPSESMDILQSTIPEALFAADAEAKFISEFPKPGKYTAIGIGPGIGTAERTAEALESFLEQTELDTKLVLDADALNILAEHPELLEMLPPFSVLTPHPKEFSRLAGNSEDTMLRLELAKKFSKLVNSYIVLKGAFTQIISPSGTVYFNSSGNPGLAKGGSGDVLTGILTALISQGWKTEEACILGVYLHGLAADLAVMKISEMSLNPMDLSKFIGKALQKISRLRD
jgi:NAD(P)H-hydrate epimerase